MGHSIPVFLIPISDDEIPTKLENWHSAYDILNKYADVSNENKCWKVTSRNWWLEWHLIRLCEFFKIKGFEFIGKEIACLGNDELLNGRIAIGKLLDDISDGMPDFPPGFYPDENLLGYRDIPGQKFREALQESKPSFDFYAHDDAESYDGLVDFFSFVKSVQTAIDYSLEKKKFLLIIQPQP